jgi:hypothetical protein
MVMQDPELASVQLVYIILDNPLYCAVVSIKFRYGFGWGRFTGGNA